MISDLVLQISIFCLFFGFASVVGSSGPIFAHILLLSGLVHSGEGQTELVEIFVAFGGSQVAEMRL